ncbi:MAG: serine/threonine protein kinase [Luteolibacter sp.]
MKQAFASRMKDEGSKHASPPPSPEEIADKFPQFEITECLGRGGMGVVYKARQKSLNRWVAIKILAPERLDDVQFAERFSREAQTLAVLNHPNIVTVHDYGETEGLYYIVMEYVDGINLRDLLRDGKMESAQALNIVPPICEALQYAHEKGIVHRDIKPENLLIDRDGRVKIADFGIASLVGATGEKSGTPPYMAPEQANTGKVDHRADIYALGVVLYEMLTGDRPSSPLNLPSQKVQLDIRVDDIVLRALSKEPERRYRTAQDFQTMVETVTPKQPTTSTSRDQPPSLPSAPVNSPPDPRFAQVLGILIIIGGSLSALMSVFSLLVIPLFLTIRSRAHSEFQAVPSFGMLSEGPMLGNPIESTGASVVMMIVLGVLYSFVVSTLCIIGGRHMYAGTSRQWAFTGAIACCLLPLWWPLGLLVGIGGIVLLVMDHDSISSTDAVSATETGKPKLSVMAIISSLMIVVPIVLLVILTVIFASIGR